MVVDGFRWFDVLVTTNSPHVENNKSGPFLFGLVANPRQIKYCCAPFTCQWKKKTSPILEENVTSTAVKHKEISGVYLVFVRVKFLIIPQVTLLWELSLLGSYSVALKIILSFWKKAQFCLSWSFCACACDRPFAQLCHMTLLIIKDGWGQIRYQDGNCQF